MLSLVENHMRLPSPAPVQRDALIDDTAARKHVQLRSRSEDSSALTALLPRWVRRDMANFDTLCLTQGNHARRSVQPSGSAQSTITEKWGRRKLEDSWFYFWLFLFRFGFERWSRSWCAPPWLWVSIWTRWTQISATMTGRVRPRSAAASTPAYPPVSRTVCGGDARLLRRSLTWLSVNTLINQCFSSWLWKASMAVLCVHAREKLTGINVENNT